MLHPIKNWCHFTLLPPHSGHLFTTFVYPQVVATVGGEFDTTFSEF